MALIPVYHMIADYYPLYAPQEISSDNHNNIYAGQILVIRNTISPGTVQRAAHADESEDNYVIGIAGDSTIASTGIGTVSTQGHIANPAAARAIFGGVRVADVGNTPQTYPAYGNFTQNRVSDAYNETVASGRMTVYHGAGGKFYTDQFKNGEDWTVGAPVYVSSGGLFTCSSEKTTPVGICFAAPAAYPSGVPGTDTLDGSINLGFYVGIIWTKC